MGRSEGPHPVTILVGSRIDSGSRPGKLNRKAQRGKGRTTKAGRRRSGILRPLRGAFAPLRLPVNPSGSGTLVRSLSALNPEPRPSFPEQAPGEPLPVEPIHYGKMLLKNRLRPASSERTSQAGEPRPPGATPQPPPCARNALVPTSIGSSWGLAARHSRHSHSSAQANAVAHRSIGSPARCPAPSTASRETQYSAPGSTTGSPWLQMVAP